MGEPRMDLSTCYRFEYPGEPGLLSTDLRLSNRHDDGYGYGMSALTWFEYTLSTPVEFTAATT
jgi:hypothetical protein